MSELFFSYAENDKGQMVHIDSVPQGLKCACICPNCKEKLLARHGEVRAHSFAHHSDTRGANLKICYMVIVYKLAEQIIQTYKRIHIPSYHDIFRESDIEFTDINTVFVNQRNIFKLSRTGKKSSKNKFNANKT